MPQKQECRRGHKRSGNPGQAHEPMKQSEDGPLLIPAAVLAHQRRHGRLLQASAGGVGRAPKNNVNSVSAAPTADTTAPAVRPAAS